MAKTLFFKTKTGLVVAIIVGVVIIFLVGSEYRAYQVKKAISDVFKTEVTEPAKNVKIIEKKIGEEFELATIKVKVNAVEEKETVSSYDDSTPFVAKENTRFILVDTELTNLTNDTFTFYSEGIKLTDSQGRNFEIYDENLGADKYLLWKNLSPSIMQKGVLVFELPNDAVSYALSINKAGTNDRYMVKLK